MGAKIEVLPLKKLSSKCANKRRNFESAGQRFVWEDI